MTGDVSTATQSAEGGAARWPLVVLALDVVCVVAALVITTSIRGDPQLAHTETDPTSVFPLLVIVPFSLVGALVLSRRQRNPIGRLMFAIGTVLAVGYLANALAWRGVADPESPQAMAAVAGWFSSNTWPIVLGVLIMRVLLLFPDGELPSPRWRVVSVIQAGIVLVVVSGLIRPGELPDYPELENPFGIQRLSGLVWPIEALARILYLAVLVSSVAAVVVRFRRSMGVERLQLKWVAFAMLLVGVSIPLSILTSAVAPPWLDGVVWLTSVAAIGSIPFAIGLAVLRYRLYEIDRLISRTLVYALVTGILVAAYAGLVLAGQALFSSFAGGSNLAIAISTLVVAALFLPLRARVQRVVDRRFNRHRYDAQRTLEAFGVRLRGQVELDALVDDLSEIITETVQPASSSIWLRAGVAP